MVEGFCNVAFPVLALQYYTEKENQQAATTIDSMHQPTIPMEARRATGFPTKRRPCLRDLDTTTLQDDVDKWFDNSGITLGSKADTPTRQAKARRLLYTWRDCFASKMRDVKATDLIHHAIDIKENSRPIFSQIKRYARKERDFSAKMFPEMEEAGVIVRGASDWGARTQFPPKKKGSDDLRVVHNYIPLNKCTYKPQYPMHRIEEVIEVVVVPGYTTFFSTDATNGYWAVPIRPGDEYKTGFTTPHGQYFYLRMGQGLKGAPMTYAQFTDVVFGPMPKTPGHPPLDSILGTRENHGFSVFMDDHLAGFTDFEAQFEWLHRTYFPRVAFGPIYLSPIKTHVFTDSLDMVGFTGSEKGLRPSAKHRKRMNDWATPTNKDEVEAFLWITPFLRTFIPGRAEHALIMKEAYHVKEEIQEGSVRTKWREVEDFNWTARQQQSFEYMKRAISENAMAGVDPNLQYHLATDASKRATGAVLFQLHDQPAGTDVSDKLRKSVRVNMFMSFKLQDAETRYHTTEREALAVVRALAEVRWLVLGSPYPVKIYTDHEALDTIIAKGTDAHGRIARWMDRLTEYDYEVHHRPAKANIMGIADGLSRMPDLYSQNHVAEDEERMAMAVTLKPVLTTPLRESQSPPRQTESSFVSDSTHLPSASNNIKTGCLDESTESPWEDPRLVVFRQSRYYDRVVTFLLDGVEGLEKLGLEENAIKTVRRWSLRYDIVGPQLVYVEKRGLRSKCILRDDIPGILKWAHNEHGHYSSALTLKRLVGNFWWPTRVKDVEAFCRSCHTCQLDGPRKPSTQLRPIQHFYPFAMVGMDFLGPIKPACVITGFMYILILVDYFSRYVWAYGTKEATQEAVKDIWLDKMVPIFGFPENLYEDNGGHFVGRETKTFFESHGTTVYTAPISHPASVGLSERCVQLVISGLRKWVFERGEAGRNTWGRALPRIQLDIDTRYIRVHGFYPSQLLMGFKPEWNVGYRHAADDVMTSSGEAVIEPASKDDIDLYDKRREELREAARVKVADNNDAMTRRSQPRWTPPREGDLVMVWDHQREKEYGRKLDARWKGPKLLTEVTKTGVSGYVTDIYGDGAGKRYHLDDLKVYYPRDDVEFGNEFEVVDREAFRFAGFVGQRALFL